MTWEEIEKKARQYPTYLQAYKSGRRNMTGPYYEDVHWILRNKYYNV